jgi:hypothetical protein
VLVGQREGGEGGGRGGIKVASVVGVSVKVSIVEVGIIVPNDVILRLLTGLDHRRGSG